MVIKLFFLVGAFFFDSILTLLIPNDFILQNFSFVANAGFLVTLLVLYKQPSLDKVLTAGVIGFVYGFFIELNPLVYMGIYMVIALLTIYWERHLMDTYFEKLMLLVSTLFIKDIILFVLYYIFYDYHVPLENWFVYRQFLTILGNAVIAMVLIYVYQEIEDYLEQKESHLRKSERIHVVK